MIIKKTVEIGGKTLTFEFVKPAPKPIEGKDRPALTGPTEGGEPETVE